MCFPLTTRPGGDKDMDFDIEKTTGSIVIAKPLDTRRRSSYNLTVEVTDGSHTIDTQVRGLTGNPELRGDGRPPWLEGSCAHHYATIAHWGLFGWDEDTEGSLCTWCTSRNTEFGIKVLCSSLV